MFFPYDKSHVSHPYKVTGKILVLYIFTMAAGKIKDPEMNLSKHSSNLIRS
jgi:hypothetical protein